MVRLKRSSSAVVEKVAARYGVGETHTLHTASGIWTIPRSRLRKTALELESPSPSQPTHVQSNGKHVLHDAPWWTEGCTCCFSVRGRSHLSSRDEALKACLLLHLVLACRSLINLAVRGYKSSKYVYMFLRGVLQSAQGLGALDALPWVLSYWGFSFCCCCCFFCWLQPLCSTVLRSED